jgi:hypothetical protein
LFEMILPPITATPNSMKPQFAASVCSHCAGGHGNILSVPPSAPAPRQGRVIHIAMDAFYALVELWDDPSLRGPVAAVGGSRERAIVAGQPRSTKTPERHE